MTRSIRFNNDLERKNYERGLAIVKAKLKGHHRMTASDRHEHSMAVGLTAVAVVKQLSALLKDGLPATQTTAAKPITSTASTRKSYGTGRTLHRYATKGIFA